MEEVDPSLNDGYRVAYEREVPCECRTRQSGEEARQGVLESLKVKMLVNGCDENPRSIRVELSSEGDLFFHYRHDLDEEGFRHVQVSQKLCCEFYDYPGVLTRMLNAVIREPQIHLAVFTMTVGETDGELKFIQNMDYKFVELLGCAFERSPEEITQQHVTFRYNTTKHKLALVEAKLAEITNLVKNKNPSLLLSISHGGRSKVNAGGGSTHTRSVVGGGDRDVDQLNSSLGSTRR